MQETPNTVSTSDPSDLQKQRVKGLRKVVGLLLAVSPRQAGVPWKETPWKVWFGRSAYL